MQNLKRRLPVAIVYGDNTGIITRVRKGFDDMDLTISNATGNNENIVKLSDIITDAKILNTQAYLSAVYEKFPVQIKYHRTINSDASAYNETITICTQDGGKSEDNYDVKLVAKEETSESSNKKIHINANNVALTNCARGDRFIASVTVEYDDNLIPNIYNAALNLNTLLYCDVPKDHWSYDYIYNLSRRGIIQGYPAEADENGDIQTPFNPNNTITVAEFAKIVLTVADIQLNDTVAEGEYWAKKFMDYIQEKNIIPINDIEVSGEAKITREEASHLLWSIIMSEDRKTPTLLKNYSEQVNSSLDLENIKDEYKNSVLMLTSNNVIAGYPDNTFKPENELTRAEACKIVAKTFFPYDEKSYDSYINFLDKTELIKSEAITGRQTIVKLNETGGAIRKFMPSLPGYYDITSDGSSAIRVYDENCKAIKASSYNPSHYPVGRNEPVYIAVSGAADSEATINISNYDDPTPELNFTQVTESMNGKNCYYLYDDNPEKITKNDLVFINDTGNISGTTLCRINDISEGIYTFFGYHNREIGIGDIFYDVSLYNNGINDSEILIKKVGYGVDVFSAETWAQIWSNFVQEYVTFVDYFFDSNGNYNWEEKNIIKNIPSEEISNKVKSPKIEIPLFITLKPKTTYLLSELLMGGLIEITEHSDGANTTTPWVMLEFEVVKGSIQFDTFAYNETSNNNLHSIYKNSNGTLSLNMSNVEGGVFHREPQYKGISYNANISLTSLEYIIDDDYHYNQAEDEYFYNANVDSLPQPNVDKNNYELLCTKINNQYNIKTVSAFHTNINSLRRKDCAAESDMISLHYKDVTGSYIFDCFNNETFDSINGLNLGNYGINNKIFITIDNRSNVERNFYYDVTARGNIAHKFVAYNSTSKEIISYSNWFFERLIWDDKMAQRKTYAKVILPPNSTVTIEMDIVLTTACNGDIRNELYISKIQE